MNEPRAEACRLGARCSNRAPAPPGTQILGPQSFTDRGVPLGAIDTKVGRFFRTTAASYKKGHFN
jgi:hypothetical protein